MQVEKTLQLLSGRGKTLQEVVEWETDENYLYFKTGWFQQIGEAPL
jgi:hypothetical protein